jgi:hypothetical protein
MNENQVWTRVDLPGDWKVVKFKWIFKNKIDIDGNVTVYKAWLSAIFFWQI